MDCPWEIHGLAMDNLHGESGIIHGLSLNNQIDIGFGTKWYAMEVEVFDQMDLDSFPACVFVAFWRTLKRETNTIKHKNDKTQHHK
jgi:hypothetical protein